MRPLRLVFLAVAVAAIGLSACATDRPGPQQPVDAAFVLPEGLPDQGGQAQIFLAVVAAVEPVAEAECRRRDPRRNCDFRIVADDRLNLPPNAFQTLDRSGRPVIAFTLALIGQAANADEMAFVMAHEAAHHIAGHLEQSQRNAALGAAVFGQVAGAEAGADPRLIARAQQIGAVVGAHTYSQEFELEADALGTLIAARAGFDPLRGAAYFFRRPDPGNRFLSSHPPHAARLAVVRQTAAALGL